jgi:hypothetical protein
MDMIARGDLSAARILLRLTAEAGDARAAAALSEIDDPSAAKPSLSPAEASLARDRIDDRDRSSLPSARRSRLPAGTPRQRGDVPRPAVGLTPIRSM